LKPNANSKEGFAGLDMCVDGREIARRGETGEAMSKVTDSGKNDFLGARNEKTFSNRSAVNYAARNISP
jgi:hypothetical protein